MDELAENSEESTNSSSQEEKVPVVDNINKNFSIEGLNTEKGIALTGKNIEYYLKILSIFHKDGTLKKRELEECLKTENIALYTIHVHALKSAAILIGADVLSKDAAELEEAGKREDMAYIKSRSHDFLMDLERLLCAINDALASGICGTKKNAKTSTETNSLIPELLRLKKALIDYDSYGIYSADSVLQKYAHAPDIGDTVSAILQYKLIGDYEKALSLIDKLL